MTSLDFSDSNSREVLTELVRGTVEKSQRETSFFEMVPGTIISTVDNADFGQRRAQIHIDGDRAGSTIEAQIIVPVKLRQSDRVMVAFNPPHGAMVMGLQGQAGLRGSQPGYPTIIVASNEARQEIKDTADVVCAGRQDDWTINEVFDQLWINRTPGRLQLTEGRYYIAGGSPQSTVGYIEIPPRCTLAGVGNATQLVPDANDPAAIEFNSPIVGMGNGYYTGTDLAPGVLDGDEIVVRDLLIDGANTFGPDGDPADFGVVFEDGGNQMGLNITLLNLNDAGISDDNTYGPLLIQGCVMSNCFTGISISAGGGIAPVYTRIVGNHISEAQQGISISENGVLVANNVIETIALRPLAGIDSYAILLSIGGVTDAGCVVENNVIRDVSTRFGAIFVERGSDHLIHANHISTVTKDSGLGGDGIRLTASPAIDDAKVTDNVMRDCAGYAINVTNAGVSDAYIVNNDLRSNTSTLTDSGTATVLLDQGNATEGDNRI